MSPMRGVHTVQGGGMKESCDSFQKTCKLFMDCTENLWYKVGDPPAMMVVDLKNGLFWGLHIIKRADFDFCLDLFREPGCRG